MKSWKVKHVTHKIQPFVYKPDSQGKTIGRVFGTPLIVQGGTWFPLIELGFWAGASWFSAKKHPQRSCGEHLGAGALTTLAILGSEWCHNLAHAAAAHWIGKPMDALRIQLGMPQVIYTDINDTCVTPRQHILRSLGGPLFNALLLPLAMLFKRFTRPGSIAHDAANAAVGMNTFLCTASLLPIPGIDGGPVLKWSLVEGGKTRQQADETVQKVNRVTGVGLGAAAGIAFGKRRWFLGAFLGLFAVLSALIGFGLIREQH